jgi:S-adenosylmethionine:tRNA ribosyltransferase-isomerase
MNPKNIAIADYHYDLPEEFIALYPLEERDAGKLLIYREGKIAEDGFRHIGDHLPENSLLIFNNTKVVEARIVFQNATGAQVEIFCLEPAAEYGGITTAMSEAGKVRWKCLIGGASKWKAGQVLSKTIRTGRSDQLVLEARWVAKLEDSFLIELSWSPAGLRFAEILHEAGVIPLPPYIRRPAEESDGKRYQTIYARHDGSVAAPTAGLHFTEAIFKTLAAKNIRREFVTLHVGAGTFLPVKSSTLEQHKMHVEIIQVSRGVILQLLEWTRGKPGPVIAVGTTSARTIESLYWLGIKALRAPSVSPEDLAVHQWDPYEAEAKGDPESPEQALSALLDWMERRKIPQLLTSTQLLITPGYNWKIAGGLVTNFHQPESTLLLLVASLIGEDWRKMYGYAMAHQFRFLSYGDGSLLFRRLSLAGIPA